MRWILALACALLAAMVGWFLLHRDPASGPRGGEGSPRAGTTAAREASAAPATRLAPTLEAANRLARERGVPVLVLAARARAKCPPTAEVEDALFSGASLEKLERCCVPVRHLLDPADAWSMDLL